MVTSQHEFREVLLDLLPDQGRWSEEEYLWLTDRTSRLLEFTDGVLEVLPMPTDRHQVILALFVRLFTPYIESRGGIVLSAPLRLQLRPGKFREPDLLLLRDDHDPRRRNRYWLGADLVLEIVSADGAIRDMVEKRREYAAAGIPEYWIANPGTETITVLVLRAGAYFERGVFGRGMRATSALLPGFAVEVNAIFNAYYPADDED
jgi:Uma2 family endonuclease